MAENFVLEHFLYSRVLILLNLEKSSPPFVQLINTILGKFFLFSSSFFLDVGCFVLNI